MPTTRRARQAPAIIFAIGVFTLGAGLLQPAHGQAKNTPFGVLLTPAHMPVPGSPDLGQAILEAAAVGGHVSYMWEWAQGDIGFDNIAALMPVYRSLGLKVFIQFSPTGVGATMPPPGMRATFSDPDVRARYLQDIRRLAALRPDYLNLAAEINLRYYVHPTEFAQFRLLYEQAYQEAKAISPGIQVGVSFHLDLMFGYAQYNLVQDMGSPDFIGFTTYPSWTVHRGVFSSGHALPAEYYDRIRVLVPSLPVVFAEVGWSSAGGGTPDEQAPAPADFSHRRLHLHSARPDSDRPAVMSAS